MRLLLGLAGRLLVLAAVWVALVAVIFVGPLRVRMPRWGGAPPMGLLGLPPDATRWEAFWAYLQGVLRGDLGVSVRSQRAAEVLAEQLRPTLTLLFISLALALILALAMATAWQSRPGRLVRSAYAGSLLGLSAPESFTTAVIWVGMIALISRYGWKPLPVLWVWDIGWRHYVLPVATMTLYPASVFLRVALSTLEELDDRTFMRVARAKGLSEGQRVRRHALRHVLARLAAVLPAQLPLILSGLVVVETLFLVPGVGRSIGETLRTRHTDPHVLAGALAVFTLLLAATHTACTLLAARFDPRLRGASAREESL